MEKLDVQQVCELLTKKGFDEDVIAVFKANKIDGETLLDLDDDEMTKLGLKAMADRKKLRKLIRSQYQSGGSSPVSAVHGGTNGSIIVHGGKPLASPVVHGGTGRPTASVAKQAAGYSVSNSMENCMGAR